LLQSLYSPTIAGKCGDTTIVAVEKFQCVLQINICAGNGSVKVLVGIAQIEQNTLNASDGGAHEEVLVTITTGDVL